MCRGGARAAPRLPRHAQLSLPRIPAAPQPARGVNRRPPPPARRRLGVRERHARGQSLGPGWGGQSESEATLRGRRGDGTAARRAVATARPRAVPWRRHGRAPAGGRGLNPSARAVRRGLPRRRPRPIQYSVTRNQERYTFSMASRLRIPFGSRWPRPIRRGHQAKPRYLGCQWPRVAALDPVVACGLRTLSQHACVAAAAAAMAAGRSGREPAPGRGLLERRVLRRRRRRRRASFAAC